MLNIVMSSNGLN